MIINKVDKKVVAKEMTKKKLTQKRVKLGKIKNQKTPQATNKLFPKMKGMKSKLEMKQIKNPNNPITCH